MSGIVRRQAASKLTLLTSVWRWIANTFWKVLFGKSEWDRIFGPMAGSVDEIDRMVRFRTTLALSDTLINTCNIVFGFEGFDIDVVIKDIVQNVCINVAQPNTTANLRTCTRRTSSVNRIYNRVLALKDEPYSSSNDSHEAMLEELWSNLKPNVRRSGRITKEWSEIGFQGTDPMSDFRGMGILSLVQLVYFTSKYPVEANKALVESNHPTRWYPFSVTGINITGFVVALIHERLLDVKLYRYANDDDSAPGVDGLHEVYCDIFTRFNKLWVDSNPRDVMAFPTIFQSLKDTVRQELIDKSFKY